MIVQALFFYLFAGICVASACMVIAARNPVHSVLYLILAFVNAAALFVMMGAEFLAMILMPFRQKLSKSNRSSRRSAERPGSPPRACKENHTLKSRFIEQRWLDSD